VRKNAATGAGEQTAREQTQLSLRDRVRGALYETVVTCGLAVVLELLEEERTVRCGPRYRHDAKREAYRAGHVESSLVLGGRQVKMKRPRARTRRGEEVELPSWELWARQDPLTERAMEQMLVGVSTRRYARSLEPAPEGVESRGTGKSAVSRRFVLGTEKKLKELTERDLSGLRLAVLMIDGVYIGEHVIILTIGVEEDGKKHLLGLCEGATENATICKRLLESLVERGLRTDRSLLVVVDGSKALPKAVRAVFGERVLIQRCQQHKKRNVLDALPKSKRESVKRTINEAYATDDQQRAKRMLENLARRLEDEHPSAAASVREGIEETLTVKGLRLTDALEKALSTTNAIENLVGQVRDLSGRVKRWRGGRMILRWCAASVLEAESHFRRVKGHAGMSALVRALRGHDITLDSASPESAVTAA